MTELDILQRAKMYMDQLAKGIDPISGWNLPEDAALNQARLSRCFFYVSGVLEQVISNGGHVGYVEKKSFDITPQQLATVQIAPYPVRITEFAEAILRATGDREMKRPNVTKITKWLILQGFLCKEPGPDGKNRNIPTEKGCRLGLRTQMTDAPDGAYLAILYDSNAQRFLLDNLFAILQSK